MSYMITAYSRTAYQEFLLPAAENADASITFYRDVFGLKQDVTVALEAAGGKWHFPPSSAYRVLFHKESCFNRELVNQDILDLALPDGTVISLIVWENEQSFSVFTKLDISQISHILIGKGGQTDISFDVMGLISREHMTLDFNNGTCLLTDLSRNGVYVNSYRVNGSVRLQYGDTINLFGVKMVWLGPILAVSWNHVPFRINQKVMDAIPSVLMYRYASDPICPEDRSGKDMTCSRENFQRAPRNLARLETEAIEIDQPPQKAREDPGSLFLTVGPSLTMAIPMILGAALAILGSSGSGMSGSVFMYTGLVTTISSAVIGAVWGAVNFSKAGKEAEQRENRRWTAYEQYLEEKEKQIAGRYNYNRGLMESQYPSAAAEAQYTRESIRLWNRNPSQQDFLKERIGIGSIPFQVPIEVQKTHFSVDYDPLQDRPEGIRRKYQNLENVPVCIDLQENGLIGVVGGPNREGSYEAARILMTQIAANNSYTDVKMGLICDRNRGVEKALLEDAKWFPHFWSADRRTRYTADNPQDAATVFLEIADVIRKRAEEANDSKKRPVPHMVLFLTEPEFLEGELLGKYVLDPKPEYGLTTILLVSEYEELPNSCSFIIKNDAGFQGYYSNMQEAQNRPVHVRFDHISREAFRMFSRRLANIRVRENLKDGDIPNTVTFLDMYHVKRTGELHAESRWAKNKNWESMKAMIGVMGGDTPCFLDIHEKYHGPHGLVAGTTGSGKSETLETYILSLAVNFSPEDVAFFIIDYKGGGMGGLFSGLPHLAGQVSNLSGNQIRRAMISIKSENQRRQRIFREYGVNHIDQYTLLYKNREAEEPVPHLLIIVDEFAELKREEPEFMQELISVAQVGRSLGVHLILSTQRPAGTVDENILSNTKFRLCLRVQSRQDSMDVLHKADAAYLTQAGRCYLQVGNDELYELFQSGYSGAPYDETDDGSERLIRLLSVSGKSVLMGKRSGSAKRKNGKRENQLEAVTRYLADIAEEEGCRADFSIWKLPLSKRLYLQQLTGYRLPEEHAARENGRIRWDKEQEWSLSANIGLVDDPWNQTQFPFEVDFAKYGHTAVLGTVSCGKSTLVQTLVASMICRYDPSHLNLYLIDFSSHMLDCFSKAPHVGGVMNEETPDRIRKFFHMMGGMMKERRAALKGGNYEQYAKSSEVKMPAVVIVLDQYVSFREKTGEAYTEILTQIAREGTNFGIYLVMTGSGFGLSGIDRAIGDNMKQIICLEMRDKYEYSDALHTTRIEIFPETGVRGRGLMRCGNRILEFQAALAVPAENDYARGEKLAALSRQMDQSWDGRLAQRIPEIPQNPKAEEFFGLETVRDFLKKPEFLPVGYRSEDASVYSLRLDRFFCYLITGEARSGKTNFLRMTLKAAAQKEAEIYVFDQTERLAGPVKEAGGTLLTGSQDLFDAMSGLIPEFSVRHKRKKELEANGIEEEELFRYMKEFRPIVFLIDQLADFIEAVEEPDPEVPDMRGFMYNLTDKGAMHGIYFLAVLDAEHPAPIGNALYRNMTREKKGIRFGGNAGTDRVLSFSYLTFSEQGKKLKRGIGLLADGNEDGSGHSVVIPRA